MEDHVHSGSCYEQVLTCGQETGEEHTHGEECYATVLTCTTPEHTHTEGCYPATLAEPTLVPEESKPDESKSTPEEPQEPAKVEETPQPTEVTTPAPMEEPASGTSEKPAETPEEAPTAEPTESPEETPEATAAPETPEPSEEPEETEEPAKEKTLKLENLTGPERLLAGQEGEWSFAAENAFRDCRSMSMDKIRRCLGILSDCDADMKSKRTDPKVLLEEAIAKMLSVK